MADTLFPLPPAAVEGPLTPEQMLERKRARRRAAEQPRGYAWTPGTGPAGETCKTCAHLVRREGSAKVYLKCGKNSAAWTRGPRSDIRASSPACKFWKASDQGGSDMPADRA